MPYMKKGLAQRRGPGFSRRVPRLLHAAVRVVAPQRLRRERTGREAGVLQALPSAQVADFVSARVRPTGARLRIGFGLRFLVAADDRHAVVRTGIIDRTGAAVGSAIGHVRLVRERDRALRTGLGAVPGAPLRRESGRIVTLFDGDDIVRIGAGET